MSNPKWKVVERPHGACWLHVDMPVWIVHYPNSPKGSHYQVYKPRDYVMPIPKGRDPWTVDNRCLRESGYKTLELAMQAGEDCNVATTGNY